MKQPLNCAILKLFKSLDEACYADVMDKLKAEYGDMRAFTRKGVDGVLMTAVTNGILEETRYELDKNGDLKIFYRANDEGKATIEKYLPH